MTPTILEITETRANPAIDGRDLRGLPADEYRIVMSDTWRYPGATRRTIDWVAAFDAELEVVRDLTTNDTWVLEQRTGQPYRPRSADPRIRRLTDALESYLEQSPPYQ